MVLGLEKLRTEWGLKTFAAVVQRLVAERSEEIAELPA